MAEGRGTKLVDRPFVDLLGAFRSSAPTPGGGSASALTGAVGAALLTMIAAMPRHRGASEEDVDRLQAAARRTKELGDRLAELVDEDAAAYESVVAAYRLPRASAAEKDARSARIQQALQIATEVPLEIMRRSAEAIETASDVAAFGNPNAASDVGVALELLLAGQRGAKLNVDINLATIEDQDYAARVRQQTATLAAECERGAAAARQRLGA